MAEHPFGTLTTHGTRSWTGTKSFHPRNVKLVTIATKETMFNDEITGMLYYAIRSVHTAAHRPRGFEMLSRHLEIDELAIRPVLRRQGLGFRITVRRQEQTTDEHQKFVAAVAILDGINTQPQTFEVRANALLDLEVKSFLELQMVNCRELEVEDTVESFRITKDGVTISHVSKFKKLLDPERDESVGLEGKAIPGMKPKIRGLISGYSCLLTRRLDLASTQPNGAEVAKLIIQDLLRLLQHLETLSKNEGNIQIVRNQITRWTPELNLKMNLSTSIRASLVELSQKLTLPPIFRDLTIAVQPILNFDLLKHWNTFVPNKFNWGKLFVKCLADSTLVTPKEVEDRQSGSSENFNYEISSLGFTVSPKSEPHQQIRIQLESKYVKITWFQADTLIISTKFVALDRQLRLDLNHLQPNQECEGKLLPEICPEPNAVITSKQWVSTKYGIAALYGEMASISAYSMKLRHLNLAESAGSTSWVSAKCTDKFEYQPAGIHLSTLKRRSLIAYVCSWINKTQKCWSKVAVAVYKCSSQLDKLIPLTPPGLHVVMEELAVEQVLWIEKWHKCFLIAAERSFSKSVVYYLHQKMLVPVGWGGHGITKTWHLHSDEVIVIDRNGADFGIVVRRLIIDKKGRTTGFKFSRLALTF